VSRTVATERVVVPVASAAAFLGAVLVFSVQPLVTRLVLPTLGGSAAVWNTALVFFQVVLLAGYGVAHLTTTRCRGRAQVVAHLGLLGLGALVLPIGLSSSWRPPVDGTPVWWLLGVLAATVGLPYLALSTLSPLVQRWFAGTGHRRAGDPYFLYAASNAGSLIGLIAYPFLVEPNLGVAGQARLWAVGYGLVALAVGALAVVARPSHDRGAVTASATADAVTWRRRLAWVSWAFLPTSLLVGVTSHISTDIGSVPLLWILPLALYLVSYIAAFATRRLPTVVADHLWYAAAGAAATCFWVRPSQRWVEIAIHLAALTAAGLAFHGRLAETRPAPSRLTEFFVCTSLGGVLGGSFNALVAPLVFDRVVEYAVVLVVAVAAAWRRPAYRGRWRWTLPVEAAVPIGVWVALAAADSRPRWLVAVVAVVATALRRRPIAVAAGLAVLVAVGSDSRWTAAVRFERSFYGAFFVTDTGEFRAITHGTTLHGQQPLDPALSAEPSTYYARTSPIGQIFEQYDGDLRTQRVGVVGLGAGTLAAYSSAGRSMTFFEIDDEIAAVATDPTLFTYVTDAPGPVDIVLGDGRLSLERWTGEPFGLLVVDAFSSDAIPVHLLTREAIATYLSRLRNDGLLVLHISNRYYDLEPVVAAAATDLRLDRLVQFDSAITDERSKAVGKTSSHWVVLSRSSKALDPLRTIAVWQYLGGRAGVRAWTDDRADLLSVIDLD
jgi:hypothetical protein